MAETLKEFKNQYFRNGEYCFSNYPLSTDEINDEILKLVNKYQCALFNANDTFEHILNVTFDYLNDLHNTYDTLIDTEVYSCFKMLKINKTDLLSLVINTVEYCYREDYETTSEEEDIKYMWRY